MLDSVITYNGNSSEDVGLKVERYPAIIKADRKHEKVSVPGRNGDIYFFQDAWNNYIQPYEVFAGDRAPAAAQAAWENIISWLCQQDDDLTVDDFKNLTLHGYHQLIDSYEPDVIRLAAFASGVAAENSWNRFGRATIDFDCRPERFTADAFDWIDLSEEFETYSGSIVSFEGSGAPMAELKFDINPVQSGSGDPSPSNVRPISGWDSVDVNVVGKNLLKDERYASSTNAVYIGTSTTAQHYYPIGTTLTLSCTFLNGVHYGVYMRYESDTSNRTIWSPTSATTSATITIEKDEKFSLWFYISTGLTSSNITNLQLELGSTKTDYEPYNGNTTNVSLGQTVYGGSLNVTSGVLTVDSGMQVYDGSSDENWVIYSTHGFRIANAAMGTQSWADGLCDVAPTLRNNHNSYGVSFGASNSYIYFACSMTAWGVSDVSGLRTWLASNPITVVYPLATPLTYQLTPTQVNTLLGQNNVRADSGDVEVKLFPTLNNPTDRNAKPFLKVTGSGNGTVVLNGYVINITGMTDYLYIDCESQNCFRLLAENKNNLITLTNGFPELKPGENAVSWTGGVTNVEIVPRWWRL